MDLVGIQSSMQSQVDVINILLKLTGIPSMHRVDYVVERLHGEIGKWRQVQSTLSAPPIKAQKATKVSKRLAEQM